MPSGDAAGMYIGNNQKPKDGEEKLHLVIEGTSELDVQAGMKEIQRYVVALLCSLVFGCSFLLACSCLLLLVLGVVYYELCV